MADTLDYVRKVLETFETDLTQGYRTKDKKFAVDLLSKAVPDIDRLRTLVAEQSDEIARITKERDEALERAHYAEGTADANIARANDAEAALVRARAVLEPFEEIADEGNDDQPGDTKCVVQAGRSTCYWLTLDDFRAARDFLRSLPGGGE